MTLRQVFFNGDKLDASASLLAPEPTKHDRVVAERECTFRMYRKAWDFQMTAMDNAHEAKAHGNALQAASWEGAERALRLFQRFMEHEAPWLKEARR